MGSQLHVPARKAPDARLQAKHPTATRQPLIPEVLYDLDRTIGRFEAGPLRSFASFAALARETRVVDLLLTGGSETGSGTPRVVSRAVALTNSRLDMIAPSCSGGCAAPASAAPTSCE